LYANGAAALATIEGDQSIDRIREILKAGRLGTIDPPRLGLRKRTQERHMECSHLYRS
jgi:hypothetical protein